MTCVLARHKLSQRSIVLAEVHKTHNSSDSPAQSFNVYCYIQTPSDLHQLTYMHGGVGSACPTFQCLLLLTQITLNRSISVTKHLRGSQDGTKVILQYQGSIGLPVLQVVRRDGETTAKAKRSPDQDQDLRKKSLRGANCKIADENRLYSVSS